MQCRYESDQGPDGTLCASEMIQQVLRHALAFSVAPAMRKISRGLPAAVVAASADWELARWIQPFQHQPFSRVHNLDVIGVELGGATKNVIGIAAGIGVVSTSATIRQPC